MIVTLIKHIKYFKTPNIKGRYKRKFVNKSSRTYKSKAIVIQFNLNLKIASSFYIYIVLAFLSYRGQTYIVVIIIIIIIIIIITTTIIIIVKRIRFSYLLSQIYCYLKFKQVSSEGDH